MERGWVDANVIIRLLTNDAESQAAKAQRLMARADHGEVELVLDRIVVAEIIWTLRSFYGYDMSDIGSQLIPILSSACIQIEDRDLLIGAIELSRDKNVDFLDAYLALRAAERDDQVYTFDKTDFKKLPAKWKVPE